MKVPQPLSTTFEGYSSSPVPMSGGEEVWDAQYASTSDEVTVIIWVIIGAVAGIAFVGLLLCLTTFVADPIMYKIDMHFEVESEKAAWLKRGIVTIMIAVYFLICGYLMMSAMSVEGEYVWVSDGTETYYRIDKDEYMKYKHEIEKSTSVRETEATEETEETKDPEKKSATEEKKTPVERGYPSNDLQYYIDHPNEPMPEELSQELMAPDSYDLGSDYNP